METRADRARRLHRALTTELQRLQRLEKGALLSFASIMEDQLYRELGYSSIHAYGRDALGFSERKLSAFVRMAGALERLPETPDAPSKPASCPGPRRAELVSVATPANETLWLSDAKRLGRRALERKVKASRPRPPRKRQDPPALFAAGEPEARREEAEAAAPLRVTLNFTPEQYARWEALIEQLRKDGQLDPKEELVLDALATRPGGAGEAGRHRDHSPLSGLRGAGLRHGPRRTARQGGDLPRTLTPALRRKILARDGHRCQGPGCTSTRFLEVHHRKPRANGGTNAPSNLITLCSACHQLHHERGLARTVVAGASARGSP
ncbi:MAG: HNH endonuclease [Candidatus Latescibacteria bacterium]|nr:HNH endonuclease [Candidatus Latescibacterota bacterium]